MLLIVLCVLLVVCWLVVVFVVRRCSLFVGRGELFVVCMCVRCYCVLCVV